ncbi:MAG: DUF2298 domain-containing protein [Anaerolineae bacterium]
MARRDQIWLILAVLLVVAASLRLYNVNWDDNKHIHPDERWITMVATSISWPQDRDQTFNPQGSTLNPFYDAGSGNERRFAYGHFPLYLVRFIAAGLSRLSTLSQHFADNPTLARKFTVLGRLTGYDHLNLLGRVLSAIFDTVTVLFVYLLGTRLYDQRVGLLAAVFTTFTVLHIQLSHFYAFDSVMVCFVVIAVYFDVGVVQKGDPRSSVLAGVATALAMASKFSAAPVLLPLVLAHGIRLFVKDSRMESETAGSAPEGAPAHNHLTEVGIEVDRTTGPATGEDQAATGASGSAANPGHWRRESSHLGFQYSPAASHPASMTLDPVRLNYTVRLLILSLAITTLVFLVVSPFAILDVEHYVDNIREQSRMVRGEVDFAYTRQYRRTTPYLYHIEQQLLYGMGIPLGLTGFLGFAYVVVRALWRRVQPAEWVVLAWAVPYFLATGSFMVKFMRYMLPLTPFLAVAGAYLLFQLKDWLETRSTSPIVPRAWYALVGVILLATVLWAFAFVQVYAAPLTRVTASEWIYRNIPSGAAITADNWDDSLPFHMAVDGRPRSPAEYREVRMSLYEPDGEAKFQHIVGSLQQTDYVIISSNRLYGWLPRLRDRYPVTNRYYELLFDEKLGFELVKEFTSYPRLDGLVFKDDRADESFTVYDHPRVLIYKKTRQLSEQEMRRLFSDSLAEASGSVVEAGGDSSADVEKTLLLDRPVDELPAVNDRGWNTIANTNIVTSILVWWAVVQLLGLLALPLTFVVFRNLVDRGYALSKALGILVVAYLIWLPGSLHILRNSLTTYFFALVVLATSSYVLFSRRDEMLDFLRERRRLIGITEAVFAVAFLLFVGIRMLNPDLWQPWLGGEKHMEFAFLNAILKSPYFPPYDPYYAGGYINYYYYGIYLVSILTKLTGIVPQVAFNLAIPTLFALTVINAFSVGFNLTARDAREDGGTSALRIPLVAGALAGVFVAVLGNLDGIRQVLEGLAHVSRSSFQSSIPGLATAVRAVSGLPRLFFSDASLPGFDYWRSTRVVPFTINEFPFFSFLFADLHPHMIGIPFTLVVLALALNVIQDARRRRGDGWWPESGIGYIVVNLPVLLSPWNVLNTLVIALTLGAVAVINTWDLPAYLGVVLLAVVLQQSLVNRHLQIVPALIAYLPIPILSLLLYRPFFRHYKALHVGIGLVRDKTELEPFLTIWGLFLFLAVSYIMITLLGRWDGLAPLRLVRLLARRWETLPHLMELHGALVRRRSVGYLAGMYGLGVVLVVAAGLAFTGRWVMALLILPLYVTALLFLRWDATPEEHFINLLVFTGLGILLGTEVVFLKDFLGGSDHYRMNTLFKFYIQVWVLLGVAGAVALRVIWKYLQERASSRAQTIWTFVFAVLLFSASVYPVLGTMARVDDRFPGERPAVGTLDGMAYMRVGSYTWPDPNNRIELKYDYDAIQWLLENVGGTPVVAEAVLPYYREGGLRVASYTGLPTLLGAHQGEQRYGWQVGPRDGRAKEFFNTHDLDRARELIRELNISYIYIGQLERTVYDSGGLEKFEHMREAGDLELVYQNTEVKIYRVVEKTLTQR